MDERLHIRVVVEIVPPSGKDVPIPQDVVPVLSVEERNMKVLHTMHCLHLPMVGHSHIIIPAALDVPIAHLLQTTIMHLVRSVEDMDIIEYCKTNKSNHLILEVAPDTNQGE